MADTDKKMQKVNVGLQVNLIVNSLCICMFVALVLFMAPAAFAKGDIIQFRADAPSQHVVVKGDTLWDISETFLSDPWLWPQVWQSNPEIVNPHLIYPGDVIALVYRDGHATLVLTRNSQKPTIALSPQGIKHLKPAIDLINWAALEPFLNNDQVISSTSMDEAMMVIGNPQQLTRLTARQLIFADQAPSKHNENNLQNRSKDQYAVMHKQHTIYDMQGEALGVHVKHVADAQFQPVKTQSDNSAMSHRPVAQVFAVTSSKQEITLGDSIVAKPSLLDMSTVSLSVAALQQGHVVGGMTTRTRWSKSDVVVMDIGQEQTQPGMVFGIYAADQPLTYLGNTYSQPQIKQGDLVVIATFATTSFGVIVNANSAIQRGAQLRAP
jgi:LysM repeat protein